MCIRLVSLHAKMNGMTSKWVQKIGGKGKIGIELELRVNRKAKVFYSYWHLHQG